MEENIIEWAANRFRQPSRHNKSPEQPWMGDKKTVHGRWSEYTVPRRVFRKKMHVHIGGSFREQLHFHAENMWIYPAEYEGLPDKGGFRVTLHERDENMCLYKRIIADRVCMEYPVAHSHDRPDNRLITLHESHNAHWDKTIEIHSEFKPHTLSKEQKPAVIEEHITCTGGRWDKIVKEPSKPDVQAASFIVPDQETAKIIIRDFSRQYCEIHGLIYDKMLIDY